MPILRQAPGDIEGRFPTDQGFDEWYGFPHSSNAPLRELQPGYDPTLVGPKRLYEGKKGEKSRRVGDYDLAMRRRFDREVTDRGISFIDKHAGSGQPFFSLLALLITAHPTVAAPGGSNLHWVVSFWDGVNTVNKARPLSAAKSDYPIDLWHYMADYEKNTGGERE